MICPVCKKPMLIVEYNQVEIDYCPSCQGIWLDQGELELLLDKTDGSIDLTDFSGYNKGSRRCPRCQKKMMKGPFPHTSVEVDICMRDGGIWLDRGEIQKIAESPGYSGSLEHIRSFFGELFSGKTDTKES